MCGRRCWRSGRCRLCAVYGLGAACARSCDRVCAESAPLSATAAYIAGPPSSRLSGQKSSAHSSSQKGGLTVAKAYHTRFACKREEIGAVDPRISAPTRDVSLIRSGFWMIAPALMPTSRARPGKYDERNRSDAFINEMGRCLPHHSTFPQYGRNPLFQAQHRRPDPCHR
jgi:hypothetical protein